MVLDAAAGSLEMQVTPRAPEPGRDAPGRHGGALRRSGGRGAGVGALRHGRRRDRARPALPGPDRSRARAVGRARCSGTVPTHPFRWSSPIGRAGGSRRSSTPAPRSSRRKPADGGHALGKAARFASVAHGLVDRNGPDVKATGPRWRGAIDGRVCLFVLERRRLHRRWLAILDDLDVCCSRRSWSPVAVRCHRQMFELTLLLAPTEGAAS